MNADAKRNSRRNAIANMGQGRAQKKIDDGNLSSSIFVGNFKRLPDVSFDL
ncbi:hypothetical protein AB1L30_15755 [Bremerella sp. JC817]|uniref:hypothetical protein n=1 Tax=Bremerella sp. JC817 TaxID=3231756 RepID=UPI003459F8C9